MISLFKSRIQMSATQTTNSLSIPFNTETTVLTLAVPTTIPQQPKKIDGIVAVEANIPLGLTSYEYGVTMRLYRNGQQLMSQNLRQGAAAVLTLGFIQNNTIPFSWVDQNAVQGTNTYTVTLQFFTRSTSGVTIQTNTRSLNVIS